jgi:hypothetical protein
MPFRARNDAGANAIAHVRNRHERAPAVHDANLVSADNAQRLSVVRMEHYRYAAGPPLLTRHVGEDRVQKVVICGRDEAERVLTCKLCVPQRRFMGRRIAGDRIQSRLRHPTGHELQLRGRGRKRRRKWDERIRIVQAHPAASL